MADYTIAECEQLIRTKINPRSKRRLDPEKATYKKLIKECETKMKLAKMGKVYVYGRGDKLPEGIITFNVTSKHTIL
jgi:hypothetical protein